VNWEYKVSNAPTTPRELQAILDRDGSEQWELVSSNLIASRLLLLLKRPIVYTEEEVAPEETPAQESEMTEETGAEDSTETYEENVEGLPEESEETVT
jgi:hypothetical protein